MAEKWSLEKQIATKRRIDEIAAQAAKKLKAHTVFMAVSFADKDGNVHIQDGGICPEEPVDFYRRLIIMHSKSFIADDN
jgi:hypothetical protein